MEEQMLNHAIKDILLIMYNHLTLLLCCDVVFFV